MTALRLAISCCKKNFSAPNVKDPGLKESWRYYYKYSSSTQEDSFKFCTYIQMWYMTEEQMSLTQSLAHACAEITQKMGVHGKLNLDYFKYKVLISRTY